MPAPVFTKLSILMAAYNEEESLRGCIAAVLAAPLPASLKREIIIVNDGSKDATWEVMQSLAAEHADTIRIFSQPVNMGKGAVPVPVTGGPLGGVPVPVATLVTEALAASAAVSV